MSINPTNQAYKTFDDAYDFLNRQLFDSKLPCCLITMQRKSRAAGYFSPEKFESREEAKHYTREEAKHYTHEIALNPAYFSGKSDKDILSTLLHEMVHLWQQENGKPSRRGYHNVEWANKMEEVGLIPSSTGEEGGARTGQSMSDYIDKDGKFERIVDAFLENSKIEYQDRPMIKLSGTKSKNKVKFTCPECRLNAWGKPGANLICGDCHKGLTKNESN